MYYGDYLGLDKILSAQQPQSEIVGVDAHDEMLFIIIHQAYELWFKQLMHELNSVLGIFANEAINDNSPAMQTATHRLGRMVEIWKLLVAQVKILETMTPMDFLDFRDLLTPASGFQSYQFRIFEASMGLQMQNRHQKSHYQEQLRTPHLDLIKKVESQASLFECVQAWLERWPFWENEYWSDFEKNTDPNAPISHHVFWDEYRQRYAQGLRSEERKAISMPDFDMLFYGQSDSPRALRLSPKAAKTALFIMLYRTYPLLQQPFQLLNHLLEIDELMATWRYRHMIMVRRMIGMRSGTGGSSGANYLKGAMEQHHIFAELSALSTYLIPRQNLPNLPKAMEQVLCFGRV